MTDYKKSEAPKDTITRNHNQIDAPTGNVYEAISIVSRRAEQISEEMKAEIQDKLAEFSISNEMLEEIFENKEQIELSRYFEMLPKPTAIALQEWLSDKVYFRRPEEEEKA